MTAKEAAHGEPAAFKEYAAAPVAYENCLASWGRAVTHQAEAARSAARPALPEPKTLLQSPPYGRAGVSATAADIGLAEPVARHKCSAGSPDEHSGAGQDRHDEHTGQPEQEMQIQQVEQPIAQEGGKHVGQHAMCSQGITTLLSDLEIIEAAREAVHCLFEKASAQAGNGACEEMALPRKHQKFSEAIAPGEDADQAWLQRISAAATVGTSLDDDTQDSGSSGAHPPTAPAAATTTGMRDHAGAADPSSTHAPEASAAAPAATEPNDPEGTPDSSIEHPPEASETLSAAGAACLSTGQTPETSAAVAAAGSGSHAQPPGSTPATQVMHLMKSCYSPPFHSSNESLPCTSFMQDMRVARACIFHKQAAACHHCEGWALVPCLCITSLCHLYDI